MLLGGSVGPGIGGYLITWGGYPALGMFIVIAMTLALATALFLIRELT